jgi:ankyrin repeat protein
MKRIHGVLIGILCIINNTHPMEIGEDDSPEGIFDEVPLDRMDTDEETQACEKQLRDAQELLLLRAKDDEQHKKKFMREIVVEVNAKDIDGLTPLHKAIRACSLDSIQRLLSLNAQVNAQDIYLKTPLHYAVEIQDEDLALKIIDMLVANGASALIQDIYSNIPFECARTDKIKTFLSHCIGKECLDTYHKEGVVVCPKPRVISQGDKEAERLLANVRAPLFERPLYHESVAMIKKLLFSRTINPKSVDKTGKTLLHHLMIEGKGKKGLIDAFVDAGGDVNARDAQGKTALFYGVLKRSKTVHHLLARAADPTIPDNRGIVPCRIVRNKYYSTIFARWR